MPLFLDYGEPGTGKSIQHLALCKMLPDSIYLCMEVKDRELLERSGITFKMIEQFTEEYLEDPVQTLALLQIEIRDIINNNKFKNIVIDGVSDIRKFAIDEWIHNDNRGRAANRQKLRTSISGENLAAWSEIGDRVKQIIRPLANWANIKRTNVFFTAQMKDNYIKNMKVGKAVNIGDWLEYDVDVKVLFTRTSEGAFLLTFAKVPGWAIDQEDVIQVSRDGFLAELAKRGLIR